MSSSMPLVKVHSEAWASRLESLGWVRRTVFTENGEPYEYLLEWPHDFPKLELAAVPQSWDGVWGTERGSALEREVEREVAAGHPCFGRRLRAVAAAQGSDDVLFVDPREGVFLLVRLTWRGGTEKPPWPKVRRITPGDPLE